MKIPIRRRLLSTLLVVCASTAAFAQGAYWESMLSGGPFGDQPVLHKTYYMPRMAKTVQGSGETVIIRIDRELLYTINPETREYMETSFADLEKAAGKTSAKMEEMKKQLEGMPPEQRKMVEQMMGGKMGGDQKASVTPAGETKTISGWHCSKYTVQYGDMEFTVWATKDIKQTESMRKDWEQVNRRMAALSGGGAAKGLGEAMMKIDGFTVETEMPQGIKNVVTKYENRSTPASEFEVPAGYTKKENKLLLEGNPQENQ